MYAGKSLSEIAGYNDYQMMWVVCRKRDDRGRLVRHDDSLPPWVHVDGKGLRVVKGKPVRFSQMYQDVYRNRGMTVGQAEEKWEEYRQGHPRLRKREVTGKWPRKN